MGKDDGEGVVGGEGGGNGGVVGDGEDGGEKGFLEMGGKEVGRGDGGESVENMEKGGRGRIFEEGDLGGRGIGKDWIGEGWGSVEIEVGGGVWGGGRGGKEG